MNEARMLLDLGMTLPEPHEGPPYPVYGPPVIHSVWDRELDGRVIVQGEKPKKVI